MPKIKIAMPQFRALIKDFLSSFLGSFRTSQPHRGFRVALSNSLGSCFKAKVWTASTLPTLFPVECSEAQTTLRKKLWTGCSVYVRRKEKILPCYWANPMCF